MYNMEGVNNPTGNSENGNSVNNQTDNSMLYQSCMSHGLVIYMSEMLAG